MRFIPDTDEWLNRRADDCDDSAWGEWTMMAGRCISSRCWRPAHNAYFAYLDKNCMALAAAASATSS